jgi:hypothetical protein
MDINGKSFDEIAFENDVAKGSVFNIIRAWIEHIGIPDIDELREFSVMVKKSGITIKQCAQSFRFIQILANFGIKDEIDARYAGDIIPKNIGKNDDNGPTSRDNFYDFIEYVYNYCKNTGIKSMDVVGWMQDMIDFSSLLTENVDNRTSRQEGDKNGLDEMDNPITDKKFLYTKSAYRNNNETKVQIPLISEISGYIEQKKLEIQHLNINKKRLLEEKEELEELKNTISSNFTNLKRKERSALTYLDWFNDLREELWNIYGLELEKEISNFVKVFTDFKYYEYDAHQIINAYGQLESLRNELNFTQGFVDSNRRTHDDLLSEIASLEERKSYSKQSLDALLELRHAGFGLKELKQLNNTVSEIAEANNIEHYDAGMRFLKDIEKQYDNKLGFELKIKELETKLKKLEAEEPQYRDYLDSKIIVSKALPFLYRYGVTDEDIINMSDVVVAFFNGNIIFNPNLQSGDLTDENKQIKKTYYWKAFIQEIKNLGDINSQIKKQRSDLELIKKEIDGLYSQRQKLNEETLKSSQLLNSLNSQFSSYIEFVKQFIIFSVNNTNKKIYIVYQPLFIVNVTINGDSSDDDNTNTNES